MVLQQDYDGFKTFVADNRVDLMVCYNSRVYNSSNWTPDPMLSTTPLLYAQILVQLTLSSIIFLFLMPLNQSRLVAEVIAGILIGHTFLGRFAAFTSNITPFISATVMEHSMSIGIVYYMFQLGLEMNLTPMLKIGRKTITNAMAGLVLPMVVGFGSYFLVIPPLRPGESLLPKLRSAFVWAIALTTTNLPDLTRILADLKLMRTDIGRTAIASSFVSDIVTWFLLMILISISRPGHVLRMCICSLILMLFFAFVARPALSWLISQTSKGQKYKEFHVQFILCGVLVSAFITDALGLGSFIGAFMFGFSIPSGQLTTLITERIEKVSSWIMVPLFCIVSGLKSNVIMMVPQGRSIKHVILFMAISWAAKVVTIFVSSKLNSRRPREAFTLGVLMNSKGLLALIVINVGRELYLVGLETSTVMVVTILLLMMSVLPIVKYTYKPQRRMMMRHKLRTIQSTGSASTFRVLACVHSKQQVQGITSLLRLSNPTAQSKIHATGVHLVELTEHTSAAMLIVHDTFRSESNHRRSTEANSNQIFEALEEFGWQNSALISVECLTAISRYTTMHVDICSMAEDRSAALIIIPFHEQTNREDEAEESIDSYSIRNLNQQVLSNAPCTVGVLVDHGLGKPYSIRNHLVMFFIGGADDREALSYAWRMVWRPNVHLTVVRFVQGANSIEPTPLDDLDINKGILNLLEDYARENELDAEFIDEFKRKTTNNQLVSYSKVVVNSGEETLGVIRSVMEKGDYDLCIVGRGNKRISPVESGLLDLTEFQELGAVGDAIATASFSTQTSVLVIQNYDVVAHQKQRRPVE